MRLHVLLAAAVLALVSSSLPAAEVRVDTDSWIREEVARLVKLMEREKLVTWTRGGTLSLGSPSADVVASFAALGDAAIPELVDLYPKVSDSGKYGIARILSGAGAMGPRAAVQLLRGRSVPGRKWIIQGFQGSFSGPLVAAYRELVRDPDREVAERAVIELGESEDDQGLILLRQLVREADPQLALKAALALAFQKDSGGVAVLIDRLGVATQTIERIKLIQALGTAGAPEAAGPLVDLFVRAAGSVGEDEPPASSQSLGGFGARYRKLPDSARGMLEASYAGAALASLSRRAPRPAVEKLTRHDNPAIRRLALQVLAATADPSAVPTLQEILRSATETSPLSRISDTFAAMVAPSRSEQDPLLAAQALRQIGGDEARAALVRGYDRATAPLKPWLAICLAALDHQPGVDSAIQLARGADPELKVAAISALGFSRSSRAREFLVWLVGSPDMQVRLLAASSLSRPGNGAAERPLLGLLERSRKGPDRQGLSVVALGLGLAGGAPSLRELEALLKDPDASVRRAAAVGVYYLTGERRTYLNPWGVQSRFEPATFHVRLRNEKLAPER
ncbi:MAG: HEAT repeat domain-containing protein [Candidatus Riflebacteria bacterium]|nr:HEAT repeat domain-containing protein [Candidatus Riflebacteria bacterium]